MPAAAAAQAYERELFMADEAALVEELTAKGVTFVEVDGAAFAAAAREAVLAGVKPEIRAEVEALFAAQTN
jgi:TRAP-type C4-dicarboxylate transport system substrate-binding protein